VVNQQAPVRFCVLQNAERFELFRVQMTGDGSVIIIVQPEDSFDGLAQGVATPFLLTGAGRPDEVRFTIHPSLGRDGLSITSNTRSNGRKITSKLLLDATVETLFALITTKFFPTMTERSKVSGQNSGIIDAARLSDADSTSVICSIVITACGVDSGKVPGYALTYTEIGCFRINVYTTYVNFAGKHLACDYTPATFSPQVDRAPLGHVNLGKTPNGRKDKLSSELLHSANVVSAVILNTIVTEHPEHREVLQMRFYFHPSAADLRLGRMERYLKSGSRW
jgi:hypothetical protein